MCVYVYTLYTLYIVYAPLCAPERGGGSCAGTRSKLVSLRAVCECGVSYGVWVLHGYILRGTFHRIMAKKQ